MHPIHLYSQSLGGISPLPHPMLHTTGMAVDKYPTHGLVQHPDQSCKNNQARQMAVVHLALLIYTDVD